VDWLREHAGPQDVVWEIDGPAYRNYARISTFSGRPTVLGWANHERVYRKNGHQLVHPRQTEIDGLRRNPSRKLLNEFFVKYHVRFAVVGRLERNEYPAHLLALLEDYPVRVSSATTFLYEVGEYPLKRKLQ